ncbi:MAG TPA: FIST N-terminal domain-containing protein [Chitinispirillaceae bacterium]|nr:FIST N-terminal domain-containing protein [Chitinispirillaceae bacterium]
MSIVSLCSNKTTATEIVASFKNNTSEITPRFILFFSSSNRPFEELCNEMKKGFPTAQIAGCTTAGEIISGAMLKDSVVALFIDNEIIDDVAISVIENIKESAPVEKAMSSFEQHFKLKLKEMDIKKFAGIILLDGLSGAEEKIIEKLGDYTDITFIGGSAGDDLKFKKTLLCANGITYNNSAILILFKLKNGFDIIKTQSFSTTGKKLTATKVDEKTRSVLEFNNKPATQAYCEMLGIESKECSKHFMSNPLGLMIASEPYVRSPQQVKDSTIIFYCNIRQNMVLDILQTGNIVQDTRKAINEKLRQNPSIKGIVNFNCILRTLELEQQNLCDQYGKLFSSIPTIGFSTYGEAYIGHINQTATMFVFL